MIGKKILPVAYFCSETSTPMLARIFLVFTVYILPFLASAQSTDTTLDVVSWNIEWFGSPAAANGPANKDLQEENVAKLLKWMDADLYGLVEIVDTMRFRRVVDSMGSGKFGFSISPYCSNATQPSGNAWLTGQKLAFVYRKSVFSNVVTRGMMRNSSAANTNWATGRFPFLLAADVMLEGVSRKMNFILVHAKAGSTQSDHDRRLAGVQELKDSLDLYHSTASNIIIGDYNDALDKPIYTAATVTSYQPIVSDSTDADHYRSITLPLARAGQTSMINFPNIVDNHIISNELTPILIVSSPKILTDVTRVVPDYVTAENTSDHYPVLSRYDLNGTVLTSLPVMGLAEAGFRAWPNPVSRVLNLQTYEPKRGCSMRVITMSGKVVFSQKRSSWMAGELLTIDADAWPLGIYLLEIMSDGKKAQFRFLKH